MMMMMMNQRRRAKRSAANITTPMNETIRMQHLRFNQRPTNKAKRKYRLLINQRSEVKNRFCSTIIIVFVCVLCVTVAQLI